MALYFLDPEREPRECPDCEGWGRVETNSQGFGVRRYDPTSRMCDCFNCNGTGRLGVEGAKPEIEILHFGYAFSGADPARGFRWRRVPVKPGELGWSPIEPTEAAALEAARKAAK